MLSEGSKGFKTLGVKGLPLQPGLAIPKQRVICQIRGIAV
jgi:hypothetical protein